MTSRITNTQKKELDESSEKISEAAKVKNLWADEYRKSKKIYAKAANVYTQKLEAAKAKGDVLSDTISLDFSKKEASKLRNILVESKKEFRIAIKQYDDIQEEFSKLRFKYLFQGSDEAYHEGLNNFAKLGAGAAFPALAWALYADCGILQVAIYSIASYVFSLFYLLIGLTVASSISKQMSKGNLEKDPWSVKWRKWVDRSRSWAIWLQWISLCTAWSLIVKLTFYATCAAD
jgi:hypothetical protein